MIKPSHIDSEGWYDDQAIYECIYVGKRYMMRARKEGVLRHVRFGTWILYKGSWILDWLDTASQLELNRTVSGLQKDGQVWLDTVTKSIGGLKSGD